MLGMKFQWC